MFRAAIRPFHTVFPPFALLVLALGTAWLSGCGSDPAKPPPVPTAPPLTPISDGDSPQGEKSPDTYLVQFETSKGDFVVEVHREWAPRGADRFHDLVKQGFYDGNKFFRVVNGFMVQWGIHGDPSVSAKWRDNRIRDDEVKKSNLPGFITFATSGKDSRTTQVFINYADNSRLDGDGFSPFGKVVRGMEVVRALYGDYGEAPSKAQGEIQSQGNLFLMERFPNLDSIKSAKIVTQAELDAPKDPLESNQPESKQLDSKQPDEATKDEPKKDEAKNDE